MLATMIVESESKYLKDNDHAETTRGRIQWASTFSASGVKLKVYLMI